MKNRSAVALTLAAVFLPVVLFVAYNYDVFFVKPNIEIVPKPEMAMIYKENYGSYAVAGAFIREVYEETAAAGITCDHVVGQYYHNFVVPAEKRYARYGCIVQRLPKTIPEGFKATTLPAGDYLVSARTRASGLVNIGLSTRLKIFAHTNNHTLVPYMLELYPRNALEEEKPIQVWQPIAVYAY